MDLFPELIGKNTKNWGMPYMGSKNDIAWEIVNAMPKAETFVDLFCGGCSITHAAMVSRRWSKFIINDLRPTAKLFFNAVKGDLKEYERFVSRAEFFRSDDIGVKILWSFGNDCKSYLWNADKEKLKGSAVRMLTEPTLKKRREAWMEFVNELKKRLQSLESLQSLQSLQRLESLESLQRLQSLERLESLESLERLESLQSLQSYQVDYTEVKIPKNAVVYCDIPYKGTSDYGNSFDYEKFYEWFSSLKCPAFLSEYNAPFTLIAEYAKRKKRGNPATMKDNSMGSVTERLYFNGTIEQYKELMNNKGK